MDTDVRLIQETYYICSVCRQEFEELHTCADHEATCKCEHYFLKYVFCPETFVLESRCADCNRVMESIDMVGAIAGCPSDIKQSMLKNIRDAVIVTDT
jgi:hypothetical protein